MTRPLGWLEDALWRLDDVWWQAGIAWRRGWHRVRPLPPPPPGVRRIERWIAPTRLALDDATFLETRLHDLETSERTIRVSWDD